MADMENLTHISAMCEASSSTFPNILIYIIQIFYGIICLLGL